MFEEYFITDGSDVSVIGSTKDVAETPVDVLPKIIVLLFYTLQNYS